MTHVHTLAGKLLTKRVQILLVGAGGTGSRMLEKLVCLHTAMVAKGHPYGLGVTLMDPDTVSEANIGRQAFYHGDVGAYKADVLINRANAALRGAYWKSSPEKLTTGTSLHAFDLVIGAVDNRAARLGILRGLESTLSGVRYWLDIGNRRSDGQAVLGQVLSARKANDDPQRLPHIAELYPEMIDSAFEDPDDGPSCSLAEALEKQSLFINPVMADFAGNLLWQLFTTGTLTNHGVFVDLVSMTVNPLPVDLATWERFGIVRDGLRKKCERPSVIAKKRLKEHA